MAWLTDRQIVLIGEKLGAFKIVQVASVMRRQKVSEPDGEVVDIIDYYPPWNRHRTYGKEKVCHEYLDHQWQGDRFAKWAGVEASTIPLYESDTALRRKPDRDHQKNIEVRPFKLMITPQPAEEGSQIAGKNLIDSFIVDNNAVKAWNEKTSNISVNVQKTTTPVVPPTPPIVVVPKEELQKPQAQTAVTQPAAHPTQPPMPEEPTQTVDGSPPQPKNAQATNLEDANHWQKEALSATSTGDVYGFDYAVAKILDSDESIIRNMREKLFGAEYEQFLNAAYLDGLSIYLKLRRAGITHPEAKKQATIAFEKIGRGES